jgi:hypothetical protein
VCGSFWRVDKIQNVTENIPAKLCEVGSEFNIFCTLVTMATVTILNLFTPAPQQLPHTAVDVGIFTVVCGSFWRVDKIQNDVTMETEVPK